MAAAELRHECTALDQLVQELFADLDRLRSELELKADEVEEGRRRLAERGRQLADQRKEVGRLSNQIEQQDSQLREALGELRGMREQLDRERNRAQEHEAQETTALQQRLAQLESERDELRRHCEALQIQAAAGGGNGGGADVITPLLGEFAELRRHCDALHAQAALVSAGGNSGGGEDVVAPLMNELAELRRQVLESRSELSGAIDRAAAARSESAPVAISVAPEDGDRYLAGEKERAELEAELELVRTRAGELQETVAQQKRELSEQREELQSELKLLRQLIEQQSDLMAAGESPRRDTMNLTLTRPGPAVTLVRPPTVEDDAPPAADPVVSSVMAQFARLQKDVAQRRQKVKK
jgi:chromosome segregation ATPase